MAFEGGGELGAPAVPSSLMVGVLKRELEAKRDNFGGLAMEEDDDTAAAEVVVGGGGVWPAGLLPRRKATSVLGTSLTLSLNVSPLSRSKRLVNLRCG